VLPEKEESVSFTMHTSSSYYIYKVDVLSKAEDAEKYKFL
jgi:hypothetical protein